MAEIKPSHVGLLHKSLGIPMGQPIPLRALMQAKKSTDPTKRKRAQFAINFNH